MMSFSDPIYLPFSRYLARETGHLGLWGGVRRGMYQWRWVVLGQLGDFWAEGLTEGMAG